MSHPDQRRMNHVPRLSTRKWAKQPATSNQCTFGGSAMDPKRDAESINPQLSVVYGTRSSFLAERLMSLKSSD
jgi:hypothetical protein